MPPQGMPGAAEAPPLWKEFKTPEGRLYWHNTQTNESVWEKPGSLKTRAELLLSSCPWKEFEDKNQNGKKYYHNQTTNETVWEKPAELANLEAQITGVPSATAAVPAAAATTATAVPAAVASAAATAAVTAAATAQPADPKSAKAAADGLMYATKEEAQKAFKALLTETKISTSWPWDKVKRKIMSEPRFNALRREGERKKCWNTWKPQRAKDEREEHRVALQQNRERLKDLMLMIDEITPRTSYNEAKLLLKDHQVFKAFKTDRDRQDVLDDVLDIKNKQAKDSEKEDKKRIRTAVRAIMDNATTLSHRTTWVEVLATVRESEDFTTSSEAVKGCTDSDILDAFEEYITEKTRAFDETEASKRQAGKRKVRHAREAYVALLDDLIKANHINAVTMWKDVRTLIVDNPAYSEFVGLTTNFSGTTALDLFKLKTDDLQEVLRHDRRLLDKIMKEVDFTFTPSTTLEALIEAVHGDARYPDICSTNIRLAFAAFVRRAQEDEEDRIKDEERKAKRREQDFAALLEKNFDKFAKDTPWATVAELLKDKLTDRMPDASGQEPLFAAFIATDPWSRPKAEDADEDERPREKRSRDRDRRRDRGRRRSRSRSRDRSRRKHRRHSDSDSASADEEKKEKKSKRRKKDKKSKDKKKKSSHKKHRRDDSSSDGSDDDAEADDAAELEKQRQKLLSQLNGEASK